MNIQNINEIEKFSKPIVAIHQPNFLPWTGYFHKMALADKFIFLDNVPFSKNSLQNRNKILTSQGVRWLTVPVLTKHRSGQITSDVEINNQITWKKKHLKSIESAYGKVKWFKRYYALLREIYLCDYNKLIDLNVALLIWIVNLLEINTKIYTASQMIADCNDANERLIALIQSVEGRTYLSGQGGKKYINIKHFRKNEISSVFHKFVSHSYNQVWSDEFVAGLSILDVIFNLGDNAGEWFKQHLVGIRG